MTLFCIFPPVTTEGNRFFWFTDLNPSTLSDYPLKHNKPHTKKGANHVAQHIFLRFVYSQDKVCWPFYIVTRTV